MDKIIGFIGLGKMGRNMVLNLVSKGYKVVVTNRSKEPIKEMEKKGAIPSYTFKELVGELPKQKIIVMMIKSGEPVDSVLDELSPLLSKGDIIIEGGNSFYKDSIKRYEMLKKLGISFIDLGVSGGIEGARNGSSLTIGGDKDAFKKTEFLFEDLAAEDGYVYLGPSGSGHYVKIIHNGIEYSLLEAYAEGFQVLSKSSYKLNLKDIARTWNNGSIISSKLTELSEKVFNKDPNLRNSPGIISGGETGSWAFKIAKSLNSEFETLNHALKKRKDSEKKQSFSTKYISLMRHEFGGHAIKRK